MRLIDGDELYQKVVGYNGGAVDKTVAKRLIDQMPTIDAVSRQAAIDAIKTCELGCEVDAIEALPSAQPEIIRCKDCKHHVLHPHMSVPWCRLLHSDMGDNQFCSYAERRTDGVDS